MADPLVFSDLYGANGLGFLVGDTQSASETDRKRIANDAYVELAGIKGWWRKRTGTYTSSSSPALTAAINIYTVPSDFDSPYRLYYREAGGFIDVPFISDSEWLERSATRSTDSGDPAFARLVHDGSNIRIELDKPVSQQFIDRIGTLTLEYWIRITRLSGDSDAPILPANLRHHIVPVAGLKYAKAQGDQVLIESLKEDALKAREAVMRHDLTRTGRARQIRPRGRYYPQSSSIGRDYQ